MRSAWLILVLLADPVGQEPGPDKELKALVERLGSDDPDEREEAHQKLSRKGRAIASRLKPYLDSKSAEIASRVRALLDAFEWEESLERSLPPVRRVTIPPGTRTAQEILELVREQTGYRIAAYAVNLKAPIEGGWDETPVLQVLDDLCRKMGRGRVEAPPLQSSVEEEITSRYRRTTAPPNQIVIDGEKPPARATAHRDQFRAEVTDIVITEQRSLKKSSVDASLQVTVAAQPGTRPAFVGAWQVVEVLDERGASLVTEVPAARFPFGEGEGPDPGDDKHTVWFTGRSYASYAGNTLRIAPPPPGTRTLQKLRLKIRLAFPIREASATLDLKDFKDKAVLRLGTAEIHVTRAEMKDGTFHLDYQVPGAVRGTPDFTLLDARGSELVNSGGGTSSSGRSYQRRWHLRGSGEVAAAKVTAWIGHRTVEIPFEFKGVPLPGDK